MRFLPFPLAAIIALSAAAPAWPQAANPLPATQMARDALTLFGEGCLETFADPDRVALKMVQFKGTKLDDTAAAALASGKAGSQAWRVTSPVGAQLALTLVAPKSCTVLVRRADTVVLQQEVPKLLDALMKGGQMKYRLEHHEVRKAPGGEEETSDYFLEMSGGRDAMVSITTNPGTSEDLQGLISLTKLGEN